MSTVQQRPEAPPRRGRFERAPLVSVVIPCLNEASNIEACVRRAQGALQREGMLGEIVVADNGSSDGSAELAASAGAGGISEPRRGYGSAFLAGFEAATGRYIVMADAEPTYDLDGIPPLVAQLEAGAG